MDPMGYELLEMIGLPWFFEGDEVLPSYPNGQSTWRSPSQRGSKPMHGL